MDRSKTVAPSTGSKTPGDQRPPLVHDAIAAPCSTASSPSVAAVGAGPRPPVEHRVARASRRVLPGRHLAQPAESPSRAGRSGRQLHRLRQPGEIQLASALDAARTRFSAASCAGSSRSSVVVGGPPARRLLVVPVHEVARLVGRCAAAASPGFVPSCSGGVKPCQSHSARPHAGKSGSLPFARFGYQPESAYRCRGRHVELVEREVIVAHRLLERCARVHLVNLSRLKRRRLELVEVRRARLGDRDRRALRRSRAPGSARAHSARRAGAVLRRREVRRRDQVGGAFVVCELPLLDLERHALALVEVVLGGDRRLRLRRARRASPRTGRRRRCSPSSRSRRSPGRARAARRG